MKIGCQFTVLEGEDRLKIGNRNRYRDKMDRTIFFMHFKNSDQEKKYLNKQKKKGIVLKSS